MGHLKAGLASSLTRRRRPELPASCPDSIANLARLCWDSKPSSRPHFGEVMQVLDNAFAMLDQAADVVPIETLRQQSASSLSIAVAQQET